MKTNTNKIELGIIDYSKFKNETTEEYNRRIEKFEEVVQEERYKNNLIHLEKLKLMTENEQKTYLEELLKQGQKDLSNCYPKL